MKIKKIAFLGMILIVAISSLGMVSAGLFDFGDDSGSGTVDVTTDDTFIFYGTSNTDVETDSSYYAAVIVNGTPYFIGYDNMSDLIDYSDNFHDAWMKNFAGITEDLEVPVDLEFSFDYEKGEIGSNESAYIITDIRLSQN